MLLEGLATAPPVTFDEVWQSLRLDLRRAGVDVDSLDALFVCEILVEQAQEIFENHWFPHVLPAHLAWDLDGARAHFDELVAGSCTVISIDEVGFVEGHYLVDFAHAWDGDPRFPTRVAVGTHRYEFGGPAVPDGSHRYVFTSPLSPVNPPPPQVCHHPFLAEAARWKREVAG